MDTSERRAVAALWTVRGVGALGLERVKKAAGDLGALLEVPVARWQHLAPSAVRQCLARDGVDVLARRADQLQRQLRALGYGVTFPGQKAWPTRLDDLPNKPPLLFCKGPGAAAPPRRRLAMVGTRHPETGFGPFAQDFAAQVAARGVGVVSGAADGIDKLCHLGALDARGETWAFLGCAIDQMDFGQSLMRERFEKEGGTFFSEFPPGARSEKGTFPRRNRLISGSADAVLVLRAKLGSGTKHTADWALKQGRALLAMPGDPFNEVAAFPNSLIAAGTAGPCLNVWDVLKAVGLEGARSLPASPGEAPALDLSGLSPAAKAAYTALGQATLDVDEVAGRTEGVPPGAIVAALVELELWGLVIQKPGRRYERADRTRSFVDGGGGPN